MITTALLTLLPILVSANPVEKRWTAITDAGATTTDAYPPTGTTVDAAQFPPESVVGYPGATPTGAEPNAIQTGAIYPYNDQPSFGFPLVVEQPQDDQGGSWTDFDIRKYWGNLSPWFSVQSSTYGLPDASPLIPDGCSLTQVHILYRHGARYPTGGAAPAQFAEKIHNASTGADGWSSWGELDFLNHWEYTLGAELLSPFGRLQNFALGLQFRNEYGHLLNNFTEQGTIPVFRTESQDRMVKTAENFAAGFFGVPEFLDEVNIELMVESNGVNNTGAPYDTCTNSNNKAGSIGSTVAAAYAQNVFNGTIARLNSQVKGIEFTPTDAIAMLQLCSYETDCNGYSSFCKLFTEEDFRNYEYYFDLTFWYNNGPGSPVSAAQGKGLAEEFLARLQKHQITSSDSAVNTTLDGSSTYFPLDQSIYADATHEVVIGDTLTALNLTALFGDTPLSPTERTDTVFKASQVFPFATHLVLQVMECSSMTPTLQARFIHNDAVVPIDQSHPGCPWNEDGLCPVDTIISALQNRISQIDFDHDCFANYTYEPGMNYNGRAPSS